MQKRNIRVRLIAFWILLCIAFLPIAVKAETIHLVQVITHPERTIVLEKIVKEFEANNPDIKVIVTSLAWEGAFEKLRSMIAAGRGPDIVEMPDSWYSHYAAAGSLENLDIFVKDWAYASDLIRQVKNLGVSVDGHRYAVPHSLYLRALFYNKKIFSKIGIDTPPQTLDDFESIAEKISRIPDVYGYCLRGGSGGFNSWVMFAAASVGENTFFTEEGKSTFASDEWIKGFEWMASLYRKRYVPPNAISWGFKESIAGFTSGKCAMLDQDPDALVAISSAMKEDEYGVVPMPKGPSGKAFPVMGYASWAVLKEGRNKAGGLKLLAALLEPKAHLEWVQSSGSLPIFETVQDAPFFSQPHFQGWFTSLKDPAVIPTVVPVFLKDFARFQGYEVPLSSQQVLLGRMTAKEMAQRWAFLLTEAYRENSLK